MNKWNKTCHSFRSVRDMINEDTETAAHCIGVMHAMERCCDELTPDSKTDWNFYEDFRDLKAEIHEEIELMDENNYESCESIVNFYLGELYDLCDCAGIWLET